MDSIEDTLLDDVELLTAYEDAAIEPQVPFKLLSYSGCNNSTSWTDPLSNSQPKFQRISLPTVHISGQHAPSVSAATGPAGNQASIQTSCGYVATHSHGLQTFVSEPVHPNAIQPIINSIKPTQSIPFGPSPVGSWSMPKGLFRGIIAASVPMQKLQRDSCSHPVFKSEAGSANSSSILGQSPPACTGMIQLSSQASHLRHANGELMKGELPTGVSTAGSSHCQPSAMQLTSATNLVDSEQLHFASATAINAEVPETIQSCPSGLKSTSSRLTELEWEAVDVTDSAVQSEGKDVHTEDPLPSCGQRAVDQALELIWQASAYKDASLYLAREVLSVRACQSICKVLTQRYRLRVVVLRSCQIGAEELNELAPGLRASRGLVLLDLSANCLGDAGALMVAQLLPQLPTLVEVRLGHNNIGDEGALALVQAAQQCPDLHKLDLQDNPVSTPTFKAIKTTLRVFRQQRLTGYNRLQSGSSRPQLAKGVELLASPADAAETAISQAVATWLEADSNCRCSRCTSPAKSSSDASTDSSPRVFTREARTCSSLLCSEPLLHTVPVNHVSDANSNVQCTRHEGSDADRITASPVDRDASRLRQLKSHLTGMGYGEVRLVTAQGGGDGVSCLRNLRHSFLAVTLLDDQLSCSADKAKPAGSELGSPTQAAQSLQSMTASTSSVHTQHASTTDVHALPATRSPSTSSTTTDATANSNRHPGNCSTNPHLSRFHSLAEARSPAVNLPVASSQENSPRAATAHSHTIIVDPQFREQFEIPQPTSRYAAMLAAVPRVYVGTVDRLPLIIDLISDEMSAAFREKGLPLPPWREPSAAVSKWKLP